MDKYKKHIITALICFFLIVILNFALPRLLPGDPIGYLTGFEEEEMQQAKYDYYYHALHLDESIFRQFGYYLKSIADGSLGYSFKKEASVSTLITSRLGPSLQIMIPATIISVLLGLAWGLESGYRKNSLFDRSSTIALIIFNTIPSFMIALLLIILLCFRHRIFPYMGLSSGFYKAGTIEFLTDRIYHLILPVSLVVLSSLPSRYLLVRNTTAQFTDDKSVLYAKQRGLDKKTIKYRYVFANIAQPFITMTGASVGACISGSLIAENMFSIQGIGGLLQEAVYTMDYPLMQGVLFVTSFVMIVCIIISDIACILVDPKLRKGKNL